MTATLPSSVTPAVERSGETTRAPSHRAPVVAIANQKGGVGKTTTAVSTAVSLARAGYRALLVDLDPQGNATSSLGIDKRELDHTVYDVLLGHAGTRDTIRASGRDRLDILPTDSTLAVAEVELVDVPDRERQLDARLDEVRDHYDVILIDCPPSLGLLTVNALTAARYVVIPIQCEFLPLEGMAQLRETIAQVQRHLNRNLGIAGVLMTMYDARTRLSAQVVEEVRRHYGDQAFETVIPRSIRLAEAPSYGLAISEYDERSNGAQAYGRYVDELVARLGLSRRDSAEPTASRVSLESS